MKKLFFGIAAAALFSTAALADPIEGNWRTKSGETAAIGKCGGSYCVTLKTGTYAGKRIGKLKADGGKYTGTITDPEDDKTYSGSATINGSTLKMRGCALKVFCQTQDWKRL